MNSLYRSRFNAGFSPEKYEAFLGTLSEGLPKPIPFRVAETPVFISRDLGKQLIEAGDELISHIKNPGFQKHSERAIPDQWRVGGDEGHPHFLTFDFAIIRDESGRLTPRLIELQGFPSLYGFQTHLDEAFRKHYAIAPDLSIYPGGLNTETYRALLKRTLFGADDPAETVLMDVNAEDQKTAVDFFITQRLTGIGISSWEDLRQENRSVFDGRKRLSRIYNRLIFDEIAQKPPMNNLDLKTDFDLKWVTHPNWFYRISKYVMPFLPGKYVPETRFLNQLPGTPRDLENWVLKPLFSFAGAGVVIDVTEKHLDEISDPENWILQRKVAYEPAVEAASGGQVKAEIRLMYLWPDGDTDPTLAINLARLSRGKMIGVNYNRDFDFVGGTVAYFEV
ncbi:MAG: hypothetical protein INR69_10475 [Mucilaginibacter polytrichastri]|nr:hypothetical protein [Mucilaginibacter polytrichastri]